MHLCKFPSVVRRHRFATNLISSVAVRTIPNFHRAGFVFRGNTQQADDNNIQNNVTMNGQAVIDNPCWGSPTECSLLDLLRKILKEKVILFESPNYLVLDKPADLRMDSNFPATVLKLLTYWYPTPSLLQSIGKMGNKDLSSNDSEYQESLLHAVGRLITHKDLKDNELRPSHQLDYATSGVLLVARTQIAASRASRIFEDRRAKKSYLAVLKGHVSTDFLDKLTSIPEGTIEKIAETVELAYRRSRQKQRDDTFQGFLPPHAIFMKWKARCERQQVSGASPDQPEANSKKRRRSAFRRQQPSLTDEEWSMVWKFLNVLPAEECAASKWKDVRCNKLWFKALEEASNQYNDIFREKIREMQNQESESSPSTVLPTFFQAKEDRDAGSDIFYVYTSIAQDEDSFAMKVHPDLTTSENIVSSAQFSSLKGAPELDYKPSLTKCQIVSRISSNGHPVTKVLLLPKTGRRHQLRVHTALTGHPILGDATYTNESFDQSNGSEENSTSNYRPCSETPRMCLHAYSLAMPGLHNEPNDWNISASDPFTVKDDKLHIAPL